MTIAILGVANASHITNVSINLDRIDTDYTHFAFAWGTKPSATDYILILSNEQTSDLIPGIHEVSTIKVLYQRSLTQLREATFAPGRDFERTFIDVVPTSAKGSHQKDLKDEVRQIEKQREAEFGKGVVVEPVGDEPHSYRAYVFLTPCLIRTRIRVGQMELIPSGGLPASEHVELLKRFSESSGVPLLTDLLDRIARETASVNPVTVVYCPLVRASTRKRVRPFLLARCSVINDLLATIRGSHSRILSILLEDLQSGEAWYLPDVESYRGNISGGWLSGEDPRTIMVQLQRAIADPSLQLFLSLYRQGVTELNLDFGYFRFWNLLEAIGIRYISPKIAVTDFAGMAVQSNDKQVYTDSAKGRVYQLVKGHFQSAGVAENPFSSSLSNQNRSLWDLCQIWYAYRNATGHHGGINPKDRTQRKTVSAYALALSAYNEIISTKHVRTVKTDPYYDALKDTARIVLLRQLT